VAPPTDYIPVTPAPQYSPEYGGDRDALYFKDTEEIDIKS
jgi:hypothetical protein